VKKRRGGGVLSEKKGKKEKTPGARGSLSVITMMLLAKKIGRAKEKGEGWWNLSLRKGEDEPYSPLSSFRTEPPPSRL